MKFKMYLVIFMLMIISIITIDSQLYERIGGKRKINRRTSVIKLPVVKSEKYSQSTKNSIKTNGIINSKSELNSTNVNSKFLDIETGLEFDDSSDELRDRPGKKKTKWNRYLMSLLLAYKLKFAALIPTIIGGLILLLSTTAMAGFFFALFAAILGLKGS